MPVPVLSPDSGPFFFAWVAADETTFNSSHWRNDESIFGFKIEHKEGDIPALNLEIRNPRIGLLNAHRYQWAWLSWYPGSGDPIPLFFGRLVGIPNDLLGEAITLQFTSKAADFVSRKLAAGEELKVLPYYDPVFIDPGKRDDPDTILEGYAARWHIDRLTLDVTASDILVGESGDEVFTETEVPYDSVKFTIDQPPLKAVTMQASVNWTQRTPITDVGFGRNVVSSYTGGALINEWPKPGTSLGGGWTVGPSVAIDVFHIQYSQQINMSGGFENQSEEHENGDTMQASVSVSYPSTGGSGLTIKSEEEYQIGIVDPEGDPPLNQPAKAQLSQSFVPAWLIATNLVISYQASRKRQELLTFTLRADIQPVLTDPDVPQIVDAENIQLNGCDVGLPIANVLDWHTVAGKAVSVGQIILVPASGSPVILTPSYQICIVAGVAGTSEPGFSYVNGVETIDGTVTWTSLGSTISQEAPDWTRETNYYEGQVILPAEQHPLTWFDLVPPDSGMSGNGGAIALGQIIRSGSTYQQCTLSGTTDIVAPGFGASRGTVTEDGTVEWTCVGSNVPNGKKYFLCIQSGESGDLLPEFSGYATGTQFADGSARWIALGENGGALSMPIGDPSRRSYFPTDRGISSLEYCICVARAHLLQRSRAVKIDFDCRFERAINLSCRKNAQLYDHRLPGGSALGKIIAYTIEVHGDSGEIKGTVSIGCAVGHGGYIEEVDGDPMYVAEGYVERGYQAYEGGTIVLSASDVGYSEPIDYPTDDGLVFPLTKASATKHEQWHGIGHQFDTDEMAKEAEKFQRNRDAIGDGGDVIGIADRAREVSAAADQAVQRWLAQHPVWYELQLHPVAGQQFEADYAITVTELSIPQQIDLEATSAP